MAGEGHCLSIRVTLFGDDSDNLRDDLSALLHEDLVIDMKVKGFDEVCVVERSSAHGSPREGDGIEVRHGSHSTSAPDLEVHRDKPCLRLLGLVLVGNRPAWGLGRVSKFFLLGN